MSFDDAFGTGRALSHIRGRQEDHKKIAATAVRAMERVEPLADRLGFRVSLRFKSGSH